MYNPLASEIVFWNPFAVHWSEPQIPNTHEVTVGGSSITDVRGVVYSLLTFDVVIWTPSNVYWSQPQIPNTHEITVGGSPITMVQGIVYSPLESEITILTPSNVYWSQPQIPNTHEVTANGSTPIFSYDPAKVSTTQVVIHHVGQEVGRSGAGVVGLTPATPVTCVGSATADARMYYIPATSAHSTILGESPFGNAALILGPAPVSGLVTGNSMKVFAAIEPSVFSDGFESGDTLVWSHTVGN